MNENDLNKTTSFQNPANQDTYLHCETSVEAANPKKEIFLEFQREALKFLEGEVIVNRKNPFRTYSDTESDDNDVSYESQSSTSIVEKKIITLPKPRANHHLPKSNGTPARVQTIPKQNFQITNFKPCDIRLEKSSDGYAQLVKILTMDDKLKKKASGFKKIIPSLFKKKTDDVVPVNRNSISNSNRSIDQTDSNSGYNVSKEVWRKEIEKRYEEPVDSTKDIPSEIMENLLEDQAKDNMSSSSTLVSEGLPVDDSLKVKNGHKLIRKGSLRDEYLRSRNQKVVSPKINCTGRQSAPISGERIHVIDSTPIQAYADDESPKYLISPKPLRFYPLVEDNNSNKTKLKDGERGFRPINTKKCVFESEQVNPVKDREISKEVSGEIMYANLIGEKKDVSVKKVQARHRTSQIPHRRPEHVDNQSRIAAQELYIRPQSPLRPPQAIKNPPTIFMPKMGLHRPVPEGPRQIVYPQVPIRTAYGNIPSRENDKIKSQPPAPVEPVVYVSENQITPDKLQKMKNLRNVELFYWQQLKKLRQQQDAEIMKHTLSATSLGNAGSYAEYSVPQRCRSVSPGFMRDQYNTRSFSLPRGMSDNLNSSIKSNLQQEVVNSNFIRGSQKRLTIGCVNDMSPQKPIQNPQAAQRRIHGTFRMQVDPKVIIKIENQSKSEYANVTPMIPGKIKGPISKNMHRYYPDHYNKTDQPLDRVMENLPSAESQTYDYYQEINEFPIYGKIVKKQAEEGVYAKINKEKKKPEPQQRSAVVVAKELLSRRVSSGAAMDSERISKAEISDSVQSSQYEEDWNADNKNRNDGSVSESGRGRAVRRDDPRRHTLGGDLLRSQPPHSALVRGMDIEIGWVSQPSRQELPFYLNGAAPAVPPLPKSMTPTAKPPLPRGYPPPSSGNLFDDDPGIMSEVETASTGFRRGGKQRSSLPVVRTPSKTLERPLGLVFLQYRSETKRALLPNEITSIDTVKALFVRSFPKQLTMEYLDSPLVKIYIHDSSKDMFYELEDLRSHLRDIRDRSVLRLFESADVSGGAFPGSLGGGVGMPSGPPSWDQDQSYFSEPEFDSEYHHQHIHKSKVNAKPPAYYMGAGPGAGGTLPRSAMGRTYSPAGGPPIPADRMKGIPGPGAPPKPLRAYGSATSIIRGGSERCFPFTSSMDVMRAGDQLYSLPADRIHTDGYMSSPERGSRGAYEEPYYTQYVGPRGGMTPVIDEETGDPSMLDDQYSLYSVKIPSGPRPAVRGGSYDGTRLNNEDLHQRIRVEHMERQLANLTGLVHKALQAPVAVPGYPPHYRTPSQGPVSVLKTSTSATSLIESADPFLRNERPPKLGKGRYHKSVSFEKSVSFSDEPPDMNSPKQHSPQHAADSKPPKPAIKSSTLPRMSSQERDRLKPIPPPKPKVLAGQPGNLVMAGGQPMVLIQSIDYYNQLKVLQKRCKDLRMEMRNLRRMTLAQAHTIREMICETFVKFRAAISGGGDFQFHEDSMQLAREEEIYRQEMLKLEADLSDLESIVEQLRGNVINRKTRVNMLDVENMALVLSKSSKTVADLKFRFPSLNEAMKGMLSNDMDKVVREEKFIKEEPERLELALRRCKKLAGTLVTLKRLANVQEKRSPCEGGRISPGPSSLSVDEQHLHDNNMPVHSKGRSGGGMVSDCSQRAESALDALLDELQTFAKPPSPTTDTDGEETGLIRRLRACPSNSDAELSPPVAPRGQANNKPPVPERNPDLLQIAGRRAPPPPPPRTSSRSPLASPAAPHPANSTSNSSSCDSVDSQEGVSDNKNTPARRDLLEQRHQELLKKQKALQEQYARLQQIQRGGNALTVVPPPDLKKTGSESNLLTKMGLNMTPAAPMSGSLTHLAVNRNQTTTTAPTENLQESSQGSSTLSTTSKVYETDIL